ncbi:MAG: acyltransferase [Acidobacteriota bacterium]|nr:acyltransferase [Acidobacteriota bacterium]
MEDSAPGIYRQLPNCKIAESATISSDARIIPSVRGTLIEIGSDTRIFEFVVIRAVGGVGNVIIGDRCAINPHCMLYSGNGISIGNDVLIAAGTVIAPVNHSTAMLGKLIREQGFAPSRGGVTIESDVWIGANCVLVDGAYIEQGAVVGAGSVVVGRVSGYSLWCGQPAKLVRHRGNTQL